jgi:hypothetical protein
VDDGASRACHLLGADAEAVQRDVLALEQAAVADEDALPDDGRDSAVAGDRLELLGTQPFDAALDTGPDDRVRKRVLALTLHS